MADDTSKTETKGINIALDKTFKKGLKVGKKEYLKDWNIGFDTFLGETKEEGEYNVAPSTTQEGSVSIGATTKGGTTFGVTHSRTKAEENKFYPEHKTKSTIFHIKKSFNKGGKVKKAYNGSFIAGGPGSNASYRKYYKGMI